MTLLWLLILLLAAYGAGAGIVGRTGSLPGLAGRIAALFLGAGAMGLAAMLGNAAGVLVRPAALATLAILTVAGIVLAWRDRREFRIEGLRWEDAAGLALVVAIYLWLAAWSWIPWLHVDSYAYHFTTPKQWLMEGYLRAVPYEAHANFYMLWSGWLFWGIAIEPDNFLLPRQCVALALLGMALMLALEIRRSTGCRAAAWLAAAWWMITIESFEVSTTDYMDMPMAAMLLVTVLHVRLGLATEDPSIRRRALLIAGVAAGFTMGMKATGLALAFCVGVALLVAVALRREGWRAVIAGGAAYGVTALLVWLPWAIKGAVLTGNPFYPFLLGVFGAGPEYLQVARDFHHFYNPDPASADFLRDLLANLDLYRRNVTYLDLNRIVAAFLMLGLLGALRFRDLSASRRGLLLMAFALLPLAVLLPARRFQLGAVAVLYLFAAESLALLAAGAIRRHGMALRALLAAAVVYLLGQRLYDGQTERIGLFHGETRWIPRQFYPTTRAMESDVYRHYPSWPAVEWLETNLPKDRRVLVTSNIPLSALLDTRLLSNVHIHGKTCLAIMTDDQNMDLEALRAKLKDWDIGAVYTEENLGRNPVLAEWRERWLDPVLTAEAFTLYTIRESPR